MKLHHINIKAPEDLLEQEKAFFCNIIGLTEGFRPQFSNKGYWLYAGDIAVIHLSVSDEHYKNEKQGYIDHVAFQTSGLKEFIEALNNNKVQYSPKYLADIKMTQLFIKSPTGTRIEINFENENI